MALQLKQLPYDHVSSLPGLPRVIPLILRDE